MLSSQSLINKQEKTAQSAQSVQNKNEGLNSFQEDFQHSTIHSTQLKENNFLNGQNQKLLSIQRMAIQSPFNAKITQLKHLANGFDQQKQSVFQLKKNDTGLPDQLKSGVENLSGISMNDVKVHYNSDKPAQLNAHAYAQGTDIHIASGQEKHLPHEAWHVVQQKQGRVQPTAMMKAKVPINDDQSLEKEADIMGTRALQMKPFSLSDYRTEKTVQKKGIIQKAGDNLSDEFEDQLAMETPGRDAIDESSSNIMNLIDTLYHTTTRKGADGSILERIDPKFFNSSSRFGGGFYLTTDVATSEAEIAHHKFDNPKDPLNAHVTIAYTIPGGNILDATGEDVRETVKDNPLGLRSMALRRGFDGIAIPSLRGSGINVVLFKNFSILKEGRKIIGRLPPSI
ncbi:MAG: hypothetical protein RLZZ417_2393 [Bacteroidota bacterium]|jgi:hypothetical protein